MSKLFEPLKLGALTLPNRIIMAPLTRGRAIGDGRIPNDLMARYYQQRSGAGLILSEATSITPMGVGYANTPGIWSGEQVEGWKKITQAVHAKSGRIFLQLWHVGRVSDPSFLWGELPVAPTALAHPGHVSLIRPMREYVTPRALELRELPGIIEAYRKAAENARLAGFDGVEIHGANGYLLDQFMQDSANKRSDEYGGSIENRARLLLEVTDAVISVWGADRVGVHLSPRPTQALTDSNPLALFSYVTEQLDKRNIAFIFVREHLSTDSIAHELRKKFKGVFVANEKFTKQTAEEALEKGLADAVAFGVDFISNPDLPKKLQENIPLTPADPASFYGNDEKGYTDYP